MIPVRLRFSGWRVTVWGGGGDFRIHTTGNPNSWVTSKIRILIVRSWKQDTVSFSKPSAGVLIRKESPLSHDALQLPLLRDGDRTVAARPNVFKSPDFEPMRADKRILKPP